MIPVLSAEKIRAADQYTIEHEPVKSIDLMERASKAFVDRLVQSILIEGVIHIFCGTGNNGGDGLAVSRLLLAKGLEVEAYLIGDLDKASEDCSINYRRLDGKVNRIQDISQFPQINKQDIVVDALFGSGLSRPVEGLFADLILQMNNAPGKKVAVDIASGLFSDEIPHKDAIVFKPDLTITFQVPKWSFFQPSLGQFVGDFYVVDIGLDLSFLRTEDINQYFSESRDFRGRLTKRLKFSHKGDFGKLLIIAGSKGKMGAAVMTAQSALRSGAGLVFVNTPASGHDILQHQVKEAMVLGIDQEAYVDSISDISPFDVIAIGPGLGQHPATVQAFDSMLEKIQPHQQLIVDADGINILAENKEMLSKLPAGTILTPHPGELSRIVGNWIDDQDKQEKLVNLARNYNIHIVLKGAFSAVVSSDGMVLYNPSGNPGMATGGSGDVLTGIIAGLAGSGLEGWDALYMGVYVHGLAGDLAADENGERSLIAGDLIEYLPQAFKTI